jgi:PleD family two-component response regulator
VVAPDVIAAVVPSFGLASGISGGDTGTLRARVLILCPCTNRPVATDLEMDAEAFAAELGDRYLRCPQCQHTHLWTKAMAWLEEAPVDEHGHDEGSQDSLLRPRRPGLVKSILIADGDERVAHLFAEVFASHDWRVTRHSDGHRAAEDLGGSAHYDAVLVGYRFEGMDGVALITRIRGLAQRQDVPIVMVTGTVDCAVVADALAAGADDVLYKPTDVAIVVATVTKCVERRRHQDT